MSKLPNKRQILQPILDEIEPGWIIKKPHPRYPYDIEWLCVFQKPDEYKEAEAYIRNPLFQDNKLDEIRRIVVAAIQNAKVIK